MILWHVASLMGTGCSFSSPIADSMHAAVAVTVVVAIEAGSVHEASAHKVTFTLSATPEPSGRLEVSVRVADTGGGSETETHMVVFESGQMETTLTVPVDRSADRTITAKVLPGRDYKVDATRSAATIAVPKATEDSKPSERSVPTATIHASRQTLMEGEFFSYYVTLDRAFDGDGSISISITDSAMGGSGPFRIQIEFTAGQTRSLSHSGLAQELPGPHPGRKITIRIEPDNRYIPASPPFVTLSVTDV